MIRAVFNKGLTVIVYPEHLQMMIKTKKRFTVHHNYSRLDFEFRELGVRVLFQVGE